jgi:pantoate--beta-alanine ligase
MIIVRTFRDVLANTAGTVALVPTMGFLHEGHVSLIEEASAVGDTTVVSVFVNPTQFGDRNDLDTYPTDEDRDAGLALKAGADILFAPGVDEVYPDAHEISVSVGAVGDAMEGKFRPGHFDGVATVVSKLFAGTRPDIALFGRKDAQQLAVITMMANAFRFPTQIVGLPTVRERDGLALSSRNTRLSPNQRATAGQLSHALFDAADAIEAGTRDASAIIDVVHRALRETRGLDVEYVAVADASTSQLVDTIDSDAFVAVAAKVGDVRLIDNVFVDGSNLGVDRGIRLENPSILYEET